MCHLLIWPVFCSRAKFRLDDIFNEVGNSSQHNFFGDKLFLLFNFCYTISYPLSLFKDGLMRPATKSKLKELLLHEVPPSVALKNLHMYVLSQNTVKFFNDYYTTTKYMQTFS